MHTCTQPYPSFIHVLPPAKGCPLATSWAPECVHQMPCLPLVRRIWGDLQGGLQSCQPRIPGPQSLICPRSPWLLVLTPWGGHLPAEDPIRQQAQDRFINCPDPKMILYSVRQFILAGKPKKKIWPPCARGPISTSLGSVKCLKVELRGPRCLLCLKFLPLTWKFCLVCVLSKKKKIS
jgi:hypothetical protein